MIGFGMGVVVGALIATWTASWLRRGDFDGGGKRKTGGKK